MIKSQNKNLRIAIMIMVMLATSPLAVKYVEADSLSELSKMQGLETILTERVEDGKLKVRQFDVPKGTSNEEIKQILQFYGEYHAWVSIKGNPYNSGIILYDGSSIKVDEKPWKQEHSGIQNVAGPSLELPLRGLFNQDQLTTQKPFSNEGIKYLVILSGNVEISGNNSLEMVILNGITKSFESEPALGLQYLKIIQEEQLVKGTTQYTDLFWIEVSPFWLF